MKASIPMAIQVVIDDVGWWSGANDSAMGGPYRTGMDRNHVQADYVAIIELGQRLEIRPQAAMILCEWDRTNLLRKLPSSTWMGEHWDNRKWVGPWLEETAELLQHHQKYVELTVHGIGHEYWEQGQFTRAEWFDQAGRMRPEPEVRAHMDAFAEIMHQNGLGPMPESMVPPAYRYRFRDPDGFSTILAEYGIRFVTTKVNREHPTTEAMESAWFGTDHQVLTVEWGASLTKKGVGYPWYEVGSSFTEDMELEGPVLGLHWPNLLHSDPNRNSEVIDRLATYLQRYEQQIDRMLARNAREGYTQLLYHWGTEVSVQDQTIKFDFSQVDGLAFAIPNKEFVLKVRSDRQLVVLDVGEVNVSPLPSRNAKGFNLFRVQKTNQAVLGWVRFGYLD